MYSLWITASAHNQYKTSVLPPCPCLDIPDRFTIGTYKSDTEETVSQRFVRPKRSLHLWLNEASASNSQQPCPLNCHSLLRCWCVCNDLFSAAKLPLHQGCTHMRVSHGKQKELLLQSCSPEKESPEMSLESRFHSSIPAKGRIRGKDTAEVP